MVSEFGRSGSRHHRFCCLSPLHPSSVFAIHYDLFRRRLRTSLLKSVAPQKTVPHRTERHLRPAQFHRRPARICRRPEQRLACNSAFRKFNPPQSTASAEINTPPTPWTPALNGPPLKFHRTASLRASIQSLHMQGPSFHQSQQAIPCDRTAPEPRPLHVNAQMLACVFPDVRAKLDVHFLAARRVPFDDRVMGCLWLDCGVMLAT